MKLIGYVRVSTAAQADEGISLEAQRDKLATYASLYDHDLVEVFADEGLSGKTLERPGLQEALAALKDGRAQGLLVPKLDRLTRSVRHFSLLLDDFFGVGAGGFELLSVAEQFDTSTAAGRMVLNVLVAVFQWERETIAERTRDALDHLKAQGVTLGGEALGWTRSENEDRDGRREIQPIDGELATVARIVALREEGLSLRAIAEVLTREGRATKRGGRWYASTVRAVLQRAA